jgi:hypothetical protein
MPTLADHFAAMLKDATLHNTTLDFDSGHRNILANLAKAANDPAAQNVLVPEGASPNEIFDQIAQSFIDPRVLDELAEAVGFSEMAGFGQYETGDRGWIGCLLNYYKYLNNKAPFPSPSIPGNGVTALIKEPADGSGIKIGIVGDWGTGVWDSGKKDVARKVIGAMQQHAPDYAIHLGDVYYSGDADQEVNNFLDLWPFTNRRSYALNSNHEMYSGGHGYYGKLLKNDEFQHQGAGYFALTSPRWLIIGLDTAYYSTSHLYQEGAIRDPNDPSSMAQANWLTRVVNSNPGKRTIILTHHDGFNISGESLKVTFKTLYQQIALLMQSIGEWWWYWGHVHTAVVYSPVSPFHNSLVHARCAGHGAIPYMPFTKRMGKEVIWTEYGLANDPNDTGIDRGRAPNGFALLTLTGAALKEEFYDENNRLQWSSDRSPR